MKKPKDEPKDATKEAYWKGKKVQATIHRKEQANLNPFDKFSNSKKKHEVINRRVKGEDRNVGRARDKAIDQRKKRLLADYQASKKNNVFADRRFGEANADLSLEDKMFERFKTERVKKARNSSLFNLDMTGEDTEQLTHKGQILGNSNMADDDGFSDDDEEFSGNLNKEVVNNLHFGGGMIEKKPKDDYYGPAGDNQPKSRLDSLQEIVMKSKMYKLQKKEAKEEQEEDVENIDKDFEDIQSLLDFKPNKREKKSDKDENEPEDKFNAYDISLREMQYEGKVQPSDRIKSDEEIAIETRKQMELLENERLRRMKAVFTTENDAKEVNNLMGKGSVTNSKDKDKNKRKRITDDDIDDTFGSAAIWKDKHGEKVDNVEGLNSDVDDDDEEEEEEEEDEEEEDEEDEEEEEEDDDDDDKKERQFKQNDSDLDDSEAEEEDEDDEEPDYDDSGNDKSDESEGEEHDYRKNRKKRDLKKLNQVLDNSEVNEKMPHNIDCPNTMEDFDALVEQYVVNDNDMDALIDRIIAWNSVHLPGAQGKQNKLNMHNFLDILMKHFVRIGDSLADTNNTEIVVQGQLNHLSRVIFKLSLDISDACISLWGRTLKIMHSQLLKRLRDYVQGNRSSCWPSLGRLLLLRQLGHVFAITDFSHAIVGPASLLLCQCLSQCPVTSSKDVASGLLSVSILMEFTKESARFIPETLIFVRSTIAMYSLNNESKTQIQRTFDNNSLNWLRDALFSSSSSLKFNNKIQWENFNVKSSTTNNNSSVAYSFLATSFLLASKHIEKYSDYVSYPELMVPLLETLQSVTSKDCNKKIKIPKSLLELHKKLITLVLDSVESQRKSRIPLQWRKLVTTSIETKNPRFDADYSFRKEYDPDKDKAKLKQLTKQTKREQKAAMRELRRDSDFLEQQRYTEVTKEFNERKDARHRNFAEMEAEQATINQQVRMGKGLIRGGGSGVAKSKMNARKIRKVL